MLIRMLMEMAGTRGGEPWPAVGDVVELPTAEAAHLVGCEVAERVDEEAAEPGPRQRPGRKTKGSTGDE